MGAGRAGGQADRQERRDGRAEGDGQLLLTVHVGSFGGGPAVGGRWSREARARHVRGDRVGVRGSSPAGAAADASYLV
ncbi:hypothetical protein GCM10023324_20140 [Streptomyces youssoufiensis]